jgi:hypothetical protein
MGRVTGYTFAAPAHRYITASLVYPDRERIILCKLHSPWQRLSRTATSQN